MASLSPRGPHGLLALARLPTRLRTGTLVLATFVGLAACSAGSMQDLESYAQRVLARKSRQIEPLPELKPYEGYEYQSAEARDPFEPFFQQEEEATAVASASGIKPDFNRNKEELEAYPLDSLRMVGTLTQDNTMWGIVKSPDGIVHRVQVGNYMGKNYGKITNILEDRIELAEIIPDGRGGWVENDASLALVE